MRTCLSFVGLVTVGTRLGDRLLDSLALATIMHLNNASAPCTLHWCDCHSSVSKAGPDLQRIHRRLPEKAAPDTELLVVGTCTVKLTSTADWYADFVDVPAGACRLRVADLYTNWTRHGTFSPHQLFFSGQAQAFLPNVSETSLLAAYLRVAHLTHSAALSNPFPTGGVIGVHVRGTDKLVELPKVDDDWWQKMAPFETSFERQHDLMQRCLTYIESELVQRRRRKLFYLSTDDDSRFGELTSQIEAAGGIVVNRERTNVSILGDFFALAYSDAVLQVTRYSTFSMAASIVGRIPLVNFGKSLLTNAEQIWSDVLLLDMPYRVA